MSIASDTESDDFEAVGAAGKRKLSDALASASSSSKAAATTKKPPTKRKPAAAKADESPSKTKKRKGRQIAEDGDDDTQEATTVIEGRKRLKKAASTAENDDAEEDAKDDSEPDHDDAEEAASSKKKKAGTSAAKPSPKAPFAIDKAGAKELTALHATMPVVGLYDEESLVNLKTLLPGSKATWSRIFAILKNIEADPSFLIHGTLSTGRETVFLLIGDKQDVVALIDDEEKALTKWLMESRRLKKFSEVEKFKVVWMGRILFGKANADRKPTAIEDAKLDLTSVYFGLDYRNPDRPQAKFFLLFFNAQRGNMPGTQVLKTYNTQLIKKFWDNSTQEVKDRFVAVIYKATDSASKAPLYLSSWPILIAEPKTEATKAAQKGTSSSSTAVSSASNGRGIDVRDVAGLDSFFGTLKKFALSFFEVDSETALREKALAFLNASGLQNITSGPLTDTAALSVTKKATAKYLAQRGLAPSSSTSETDGAMLVGMAIVTALAQIQTSPVKPMTEASLQVGVKDTAVKPPHPPPSTEPVALTKTSSSDFPFRHVEPAPVAASAPVVVDLEEKKRAGSQNVALVPVVSPPESDDLSDILGEDPPMETSSSALSPSTLATKKPEAKNALAGEATPRTTTATASQTAVPTITPSSSPEKPQSHPSAGAVSSASSSSGSSSTSSSLSSSTSSSKHDGWTQFVASKSAAKATSVLAVNYPSSSAPSSGGARGGEPSSSAAATLKNLLDVAGKAAAAKDPVRSAMPIGSTSLNPLSAPTTTSSSAIVKRPAAPLPGSSANQISRAQSLASFQPH